MSHHNPSDDDDEQTAPAAVQHLLADAALAFVRYDTSGNITDFDLAAQRLFGYSASEVIHKKTHALLHGRSATFPFQDTSGDLKLEFQRQDSRLLLLTATAQRDPHGWLVLYRDVSELEAARKQLDELRDRINRNKRQTEKEAEFLRQLLAHTMETVRFGLAVQDASSGMIAYVNDGFEKITGLAKLQVEGNTFSCILPNHREAGQRLNGFVADILAGSQRGEKAFQSGHWEMEFPSGKKNIEAYGRTIFVEGHERTYVLLIIEDHTERQRLQMQLVQSEKLAAIGQLAAGIAHEIRNPLATIYNALYDLNELLPNPSSDIAEDIDVSMEEIRRVQDIINNLLDFARESGGSPGRSNLNDVLLSTLRLVAHDLENKRIELKWELGEVPEVAIGSNALKQIFINLITNAAQAMAEGGTLGIRTSARTGQIPLHGATGHGEHEGVRSYRLEGTSGVRDTVYTEHVTLEISDTGTGIPQELLPSIFNPFFTTKAPGSGTGLGLSVVHSLIKEAGGAISVRTAKNLGTTFSIELPAVAVEE